jgi:SAM-dependent methyltransferase
MKQEMTENMQDQFVARVSGLWQNPKDRIRIANCIQALDTRYNLYRKMAHEPGVAQIIEQMSGRLARNFVRLADLQNKRILDIACGSNTSKLPASLHLKTPFGEMSIGASKGYTALFEPWFCRILFELGTTPVGLDFGDLEQEAFIHYRVDLGKPGALDFLPDASFDGIQDSRLFGSPEFTAQFPDQADRLKVAQEIKRQEQRLLKPGGIIIHSDARAW